MSARTWLVDVLLRTAERLDPDRPVTVQNSDGSYSVWVGHTAIANIQPGKVYGGAR